MSAMNISTLIGEPKQGVTYAGRWFLNASISTTTSGDKTVTPSQMTLDTTYPNANGSALVSSNTSYFAIQFPVQGIYAITWNSRGSVTVPATSTQDVWNYIGMHTYNGTVNKAIGTQPDLEYRHAMFQNTWTNPASSSTTFVTQHSPTIVEEFKAGDTIAPWYGPGTTAGFTLTGSSSNIGGTLLTVVLLRRTA